MGSEDQTPHEALLAWAASHGTTLHPSITIQPDPETGFSFFAKTSNSIPQSSCVVACSTAITLSYLNTLVPPAPNFHQDDAPFPDVFLSQAPPHVISQLLLIKEYLKGEASFWYPYIRTLPQPDDDSSRSLPPFWKDDEREWFDGTNLEVSILEIRSMLRQGYEDARRLLGRSEVCKVLTPRLYDWAYSIFASRSFMPQLVLPNHDSYHLHEGVSCKDFSVLVPLFDVGNHDMKADVTWEMDPEKDLVKLVSGQGHAPGEQVFNNYGMKTNSQLLLAYGFMIGDGDKAPEKKLHNDYVHVRKRGSLQSKHNSNADNAPREWLLGSMPMTHTASHIGRILSPVSLFLEESNRQIFPPLALVQEGMVLDLILTLASSAPFSSAPDVQDLLKEDHDFILQKFLTVDIRESGALRAILDQIMGILQHKVLQEMEKLDEGEAGMGLVDGTLPPGLGLVSERHGLAMRYRTQVRLVLTAIASEIEDMYADED